MIQAVGEQCAAHGQCQLHHSFYHLSYSPPGLSLFNSMTSFSQANLFRLKFSGRLFPAACRKKVEKVFECSE
jgi:hypothetical protein